MTKIDTIGIPELKFTKNGELDIIPSPASSKNDFDFFIGKWAIRNKKLKTRLNGCTEWIEFESAQEMHTILNGAGNIDNFKTSFDGKPFEGMSLRLFNPKTKLWSIYWADSNVVKLDPPVTGSFENNLGYFFTKDNFEGRSIIVAFKWDVSDNDNLVWSQAFSADNGATWEWNWYMYFVKLNN
jgi:hypothetical protein